MEIWQNFQKLFKKATQVMIFLPYLCGWKMIMFFILYSGDCVANSRAKMDVVSDDAVTTDIINDECASSSFLEKSEKNVRN